MPVKPVLDDRKARNRVVTCLRSGGTLDDAATEIGTTRQSINRYARKHPDFRDAMEAARAEAERRAAIAAPIPSTPPPQPPSRDAVIAAEVMGVDPDLVADAEDFMADDVLETLIADGIDLSRASPRAYIHICWSRFLEGGKEAPKYGALLKEVMVAPTLRAQIRRDEARARREALEDQKAIAVQAESAPAKSTAGMVVLVAPPNKARPFLRAEDGEAVDAELVE